MSSNTFTDNIQLAVADKGNLNFNSFKQYYKMFSSSSDHDVKGKCQ